MYHTPTRRPSSAPEEFHTPLTFSKELKQVLNERNLLTAKTRKRVCSLLDRITPDKNNGFDRRQSFRQQAIQEIISSEKAYLKQLEILMEFFVVPLKTQEILSDSCHTALFGQIEMIYNLNGELLKEIEKNQDNVAEAFLKMAPFFKLYSVYAFDYKNSLLILQDFTSKDPVFRKFLENAESRPEVQRKLNSLMIAPIQRVPRYKLLLEQVLLYTSPADVDFKLLKESVKLVESTVSHINSVIEDQEVTQRLLNIQNSLVNRTPNIVKPSRKVIKEGILNKVNRKGDEIKRYCVLMSDIFMYCKILKDRPKDTVVENSLECCCIFPLKKCKVYEMFPGNFKITCQGDGIILCTSDLNLGRTWVGFIKDAIELHIICRKTLRKESSKRTPIRKKDIKYFDSDFLVSPNKRKCDYESVFRNKRSTDSDDSDGKSSCFGRFKEVTNNLKRSKDEPYLPVYTNSLSKAKNSLVTDKISACPPRRRSILKKTKPIVIKKDEHDPTYGFATHFNDSESYFRAQKVDSTIPTTVTRQDFFNETSADGEGNLKDILFPLRTSGGSNKSGSTGWMATRRGKENRSCAESGASPRKRVKFDDLQQTSYSKLAKAEPYKFSNNVIMGKNSGPTPAAAPLHERIIDFFVKLF
ncbi:pleckstrin homology domain-containing family G member 3 [Eupeodes corollae]|uniref:pleckstrin homology domain-containing family G member 3 n=1 Tax=Eupeodes corollae TaxID=290404 RepID=UPI002492B4E1|nr:pleckstrin homology domain-containing family G member 3 [Eupeodes corollae]